MTYVHWPLTTVSFWPPVLQLLNFSISFAIIIVLFSIIYKRMPRARIAWRDVWVGAAVTALLFEVGKLLIGVYLGTTGVASSFGAAGSLVVMLVWVCSVMHWPTNTPHSCC